MDERSRGFRWFFSFYIVFAADTQGGDAEGAILLLDEPGLFLHALSQADLLRHFDNDFKNSDRLYHALAVYGPDARNRASAYGKHRPGRGDDGQ